MTQPYSARPTGPDRTRARRGSVRVAIVAASPRIIGGHSVQATALASALRADGMDVRLIDIDRRLPPAIRRQRGVRTIVNELAYGWALRELASVDIVHAFSASYWSFLLAPVPALLAGRALRRRVILHYHSGEVSDHLANWGWRVHPWLRAAHEIVVCSAFQQAVFASYGYHARVIPNVIDVSRFTFRDREVLRPRFICTRNFETHYGVDVVIDAFARVLDRRPDATLVLVGEGSQRAALEAHAAAVGRGRITFAGAVRPEAMPACLDAADIFLNASTIDNQPVSLLEAAASGLPVISTRVGGIGELIEHGRSGWLVDSRPAEAMAAAALCLLDNPAHGREIAARARAGVLRFTWAAVRPLWETAYGLRPPARQDASAERGRLSAPARGVSA
jgi:glycosyltransferase involved in cell wall biosynthesis